MTTLVVLGAGASVPAGLPVTADLNERVAELLPDALGTLLRGLLRVLGDISSDRALNIEDVIAAIRFVRNRADLPEANLVATWVNEVQELLETGVSADRYLDRIERDVVDALVKILWIGDNTNAQYLEPLFSIPGLAAIASLNYDNLVESAAASAGVSLYQGQWEGNLLIEAGPMPPGTDAVPFLKLHGSLDWGVNPQGDLRQVAPDSALEKAVVIGGGNKLRADGPFLDLMASFRVALKESDRVITIGYGFGDVHINEMIRAWCRQPPRHGVVRQLRVCNHNGQLPDPVRGWHRLLTGLPSRSSSSPFPEGLDITVLGGSAENLAPFIASVPALLSPTEPPAT